MEPWLRIILYITAVAVVGATPSSLRNSSALARRSLGAELTKTGGPQYRLPMTAVPTRYELTLDVDIPTSDAFLGSVTVTLVAVRKVSFVTLHVNHDVLQVYENATLTGPQGARLAVTLEKDAGLQTLTLRLTKTLTLGETYYLTVYFDGKLRSDMYGFYRSTHKTKAGTEMVLAATQFEPAHARSAFPCWDEPQYKAVFSITISHGTSLTALSNTAVDKTEVIPTAGTVPERKETKFVDTPVMSTYLVAFVVSDFQAKPSTDTSILPGAYNVYVQPEQLALAEYAAQVGPKALKELQDFAGTGVSLFPTELKKLDLVAIPDFSAGAMENWGLITFRETALMFKEGESTESAKESIALVIAHEEAHMWFGDLVSPEWWGYAWLNEGFARYMQYVSMAKVEPDWDLMDTFVVQTVQGALAADGLATSHPLSATVYTPDQISDIFDSITYDKGASILHMTSSVLGAENFKTAINKYLTQMKYSVAAPHDLFRAFDLVAKEAQVSLPAGVTMATVLETWTREAGYPLITIHKAEDGTATVTQEPFLSPKAENAAAEPRWWVQLTYISQGGNFDSPTKVWLDPKTNATLTGLGGGWLMANIKQTGFYRVNYDERTWSLLSEHLVQSSQQVPALSRAQLLDDALSLARAGVLRYPVALEMTRFLHNDTEPVPWTTALRHISFLNKMLASTDTHDTFKTYVLDLVDSVYKSVGFEEAAGDRHLRKTFRSLLLTEACALGLQGCVDKASAAFTAFKSSPGTPPSPNVRSAVYCTGLRASTAIGTDWEFLWQRYSAVDTIPGERSVILSALGCTGDNATLNKYLLKSLDAAAVRQQDASSVFVAVLRGGGASGVDLAFEFFTTNLDAMIKSYGGWSAMQKVIDALASAMLDNDRLNKLEDFLTTNSAKLGAEQVAAAVRAVENARSNLAWRDSNLDTISAWLHGASTSGASHARPALLATAFIFLLAWIC